MSEKVVRLWERYPPSYAELERLQTRTLEMMAERGLVKDPLLKRLCELKGIEMKRKPKGKGGKGC